jgi:hypothetical protein
MLTRLLCVTLLLASCGGRSAGHGTDTGPDRGARDGKPPDVQVQHDSGGQDQGGQDQGTNPGFCKGPPAAEADGQKLQVSTIRTHLDLVGSCCPPGEILNFDTLTALGTVATIRLEIARFPGVQVQKRVDLARPPPGWVFIVRCDARTRCGMVTSTNSKFTGYIEFETIVGGPAVMVTACLSAKPKSPTDPSVRPVKLWAQKQLVNLACVPGMDQTCNNDPRISSIHGRCNPDSTCTCLPGFPKLVNGKCQ